MRKLITAGFALAFAAVAPWAKSAAAQTQSAIGKRLADYGGFVGLDFTFGDVKGDFGAFVGGEAALLLKHRIYVGVRGAGLATDNALVQRAPQGATYPLQMGYGGILFGYVIPSSSLLEVSADVLVGAGGVSVNAGEDASGATNDEDDAVFVFEPSVSVGLKLTPFARIGVGASYRFVGDVDLPGMRDRDLRGVTGGVTIRVGRF